LIETEGKDKVEAHEELSRASESRRDSLRSIASFFSQRSIQADQELDSPRASSIQGASSKFDFQSPGKGTKPNQVAPGKRMSAFGQAKLPDQGNKSPESGGLSDEVSSPFEVDHSPKAPVENKFELPQIRPQEAPVENKFELPQIRPQEAPVENKFELPQIRPQEAPMENKIELAQSPDDENNVGHQSD
jgi:hypothetical protein